MDKDTREHLAALVGRLRRLADAPLVAERARINIVQAADAIEALVSTIDRLAAEIGSQRATIKSMNITYTIGGE